MNQLKANNKRRAGFSLAELMVVIVILGLLVSVVAPNVFGYLFKGQEAKVRTDLTVMAQSIEAYMLDNNMQAPDSLDVLVEPDPDTGVKFLNRNTVPTDPWGNEYVYEPPSAGEPFRIYSMGEDGSIGGEAKARDLDLNWARNDEEE
ncbi:MAG: type II secretion system major pseudopilin GspG [Planctomycetota bacterium]